MDLQVGLYFYLLSVRLTNTSVCFCKSKNRDHFLGTNKVGTNCYVDWQAKILERNALESLLAIDISMIAGKVIYMMS